MLPGCKGPSVFQLEGGCWGASGTQPPPAGPEQPPAGRTVESALQGAGEATPEGGRLHSKSCEPHPSALAGKGEAVISRLWCAVCIRPKPQRMGGGQDHPSVSLFRSHSLPPATLSPATHLHRQRGGQTAQVGDRVPPSLLPTHTRLHVPRLAPISFISPENAYQSLFHAA